MERGASRRTKAPEELRCQSTVPEPDDRQTDHQYCDHFSIRGYVALLQKKDPKLCSLSQIFCDQEHDEEQCKNLCSIPGANFRRWDCSNCLKKVQNAGLATTSRTVSVNQDGWSVSIVQTFMPNNAARRLFPCAQRLSLGNTVGRSTPSQCCQESHSKFISPSSSNKGVTEANVYPAMKSIMNLLNAKKKHSYFQDSPNNLDVYGYCNVSGIPNHISGHSNLQSGGDQVYNRVQHEASTKRNNISYLKVYQRRSRNKRLLSEITKTDKVECPAQKDVHQDFASSFGNSNHKKQLSTTNHGTENMQNTSSNLEENMQDDDQCNIEVQNSKQLFIYKDESTILTKWKLPKK